MSARQEPAPLFADLPASVALVRQAPGRPFAGLPA
jgi:hypothetical protein